MKKYDIFISYRRDGGAETAKHLRDTLTEKGYRVFLDVESLRSGQFNDELYRVIENSKDFLLILSENGLDRCRDENDWVRLEVEHAKNCGKNIIPIMLKGFVFPEELPGSLEYLRTQNGLATNAEYYDAFVKRLIGFLKSRRRTPKSLRWIPVVASIVLVALLTFLGFSYFSKYPRTAAQKNLVSDLINYCVLNLQYVDKAGAEYNKVLDDAIAYANDNTLLKEKDLVDELDAAYDKLTEYHDYLFEMDDQLEERLKKSPFDTGNLSAMIPYFQLEIDNELKSIDYLRNYFSALNTGSETAPTDDAQRLTLLRYLQTLKELSALEANTLFLNLNEVLLPVTNESALEDLKRDFLPDMTYIYADKPKFERDLETIRGKMELNYNRSQELMEQYNEDLGLLKNDTEEVSWDKGVFWFSIGLTDEAEQIFRLCLNHCDENEAVCVNNVLKLIDNYAQSEVKSGVVVFGVSSERSDPPIKVGDIIFEVDGVSVSNKAEFEAAAASGQKTVKLLRFDDSSYRIIEADYDASVDSIEYRGLSPEP